MNSYPSILNSSPGRLLLADDAVEITSYLNTSWLAPCMGPTLGVAGRVQPGGPGSEGGPAASGAIRQ